MQKIIDLASARLQRQQLAQQAENGAELFIAGLQHAGQSLANVAWILAAPIRHRDNDLKKGIYGLVLVRLHKIITGAMQDIKGTAEIKNLAMEQATSVAFAAFKTQLLILAAAEQDSKPAS